MNQTLQYFFCFIDVTRVEKVFFFKIKIQIQYCFNDFICEYSCNLKNNISSFSFITKCYLFNYLTVKHEIS